MYEVPAPVKDRLNELDKLVNDFPTEIPLVHAADFLRMDPPSLRAYLQTNTSFGMAWKKEGKTNCGFHIPTLTFYMWVTQSNISRGLSL